MSATDISTEAAAAPIAPDAAEASQARLIWRGFRRHRLAMVSLVFLGFLYLIAIFAEIIAPDDPHEINARYTYAPPQAIHFFAEDSWTWQPHVHGYKVEVDPVENRHIAVAMADLIEAEAHGFCAALSRAARWDQAVST